MKRPRETPFSAGFKLFTIALGIVVTLLYMIGCAYRGTPPGAMPACQSMHCIYVANGWTEGAPARGWVKE